MNEIEIQFEGIDNISLEIQQDFLKSFKEKLDIINLDNINYNICKSLNSVLYNKRTDILNNTCKRIKKCEEYKECNICFENFKQNEYKREIICEHHFHCFS